MKKKMVHIVNQLKLGEITTKEAKEELLILFGVSGSLCENCEPDEIDVTRCPKCKSTDHRIDKPYKCHDCGTVW